MIRALSAPFGDAAHRPICDLQASGGIELYFYDELSVVERAEVESHLRGCAECGAALGELRLIRDLLADRPDVSAPPGADWTTFMARLETTMAASRRVPGWPTSSPRHITGGAAIYLAMAALVALISAGVVMVEQQRATGQGATAPVDAAVARPADAPMASAARPASARPADAGFAAVSEQHFERSKLVILGLATKNSQTASPSDWAYERHLASALLDDNRIYRHAAEERGLDSLAGVMSDLELVLLQTSLSDQRDIATLDRLQRLIQRRDLVAKMEGHDGFRVQGSGF